MKINKNSKQELYGSGMSKKIEQLKNGLRQIEEKNIEYFKKRKSKRKSEKFDKLHNYYSIILSSNIITFCVADHSDLDEKIKSECIKLVSEISL